jgi:uncharacterized protein YjbI with pentapeptide repeats
MQPTSGVSRRGKLLLASTGGAVVLGTVLWLCVAVLPQRLYPPLSNGDLAGLSAADRAARREGRAKLQNDARTTLLQALAALLVLGGAGIGATVTLRQVRIAREGLEQARQQTQQSDEHAREQLELAREQARRSDERLSEQIAVAQQGQITERFTRSVDQLGNAQLDVRLGGIYALERIARDSAADQATIGEILTAFVRSHSPWPPCIPDQPDAATPIDEVPELQARAADVQACLTVLARSSFAPPKATGARLDLHAVDLRHAYLRGAHLERANLRGAHLERANLCGAHLEQATLVGAHLKGAKLVFSHLEAAMLDRAHLENANLYEAHLEGAEFYDAHLERAYLGRANLEGATLMGARLNGTIFVLTHLEGTHLGSTHLEGAIFDDVHLERADLRGADLKGAIANQRTSWPEGFEWQDAGVILIDKDVQKDA